MNTRKLTLIGLALTSMITLGGCSSISQREYDAAIDENTELRSRIATLQDSVRDSNETNGSYQGQNQELRDENARLIAELERANEQSATGFEGVNGVDVSRRGGGGEVVVNIAGDVLFNSGSAELRKDAKKSLDEIASVLKSNYGANEIRVEGYTDSDKLKKTKAKWGTNENLSSARAQAVEIYLVSKGVDNKQIYSAAFGPAKAKGTKKDSRRVEIVILGS
jgi:chemotaxis protein MotB